MIIRTLVTRLSRYPVQFRRDALIVLLLALGAGMASYRGTAMIDPAINSRESWDAWFDSDVPRVFDVMVAREADHSRSNIHPLFSLVAFPPVYVLRRGLHVEPATAVRIFMATAAAVWLTLIYAVLRVFGLRRLDAVLFSLLGAVSSTAVFWLVVAETFPFGSITILFALLVFGVGLRSRLPMGWSVAANVATLSVTITNWAIALLGTILAHSRRDVVRTIAVTLGIVLSLSVVQANVFPSAQVARGPTQMLEQQRSWVLPASLGGPWTAVKAALFHSMVMPAIYQAPNYGPWKSSWPVLRVQTSAPGSGTKWGRAAVIAWSVMIGMAVVGIIREKARPKLRLFLAGSLVSQLVLFAVFGRETFLFAMHVLPLLLVFTAVGGLSLARFPVLILTAVTVLLAGANNAIQFREATRLFKAVRPTFPTLAAQMAVPDHPDAGQADNALAVQVREGDANLRASLGPAGSFSPEEGSFGLSLWILDANDRVIHTSDNLRTSALSQAVQWRHCGRTAAVESNTMYYRARLNRVPGAFWQMDIQKNGDFASRLALTVRSRGPSGGTVESLDWADGRLIINERWALDLLPLPTQVYLGEETEPGRFVRSTVPWKKTGGDGYAVMVLEATDRFWVARVGSAHSVASEVRSRKSSTPVYCDLAP